MEDVIAQVEKLAATILANERTTAFRDAAAALEADAPARQLQEDYTVAIEDIRGREAKGQPIEPEAKRTMAAMADQIRKSPVLQRFLRANMEFTQLMDAVQQTLGGAIDAVLFPDAGNSHEGHAGHEGHNHGPGESCGADEPEPPPPEKKGPILWTP